MLTLPLVIAVATAGLIGGFHCIGMCGGISHFFSQMPYQAKNVIPIQPSRETSNNPASAQRRFSWYLHAGRLMTYTIIGAMFGGVGAAMLAWKSASIISTIFYFFGNVFLVLLGLRLLGFDWQAMLSRRFSRVFEKLSTKLTPTIQRGGKHPVLLGLAWGAFPCGLSYAVAPFAILSGAAWSGALLMLLFGLTALPHLLITQTASKTLRNAASMQGVKYLAAMFLIGVGVFGLFLADMHNMPDFLCVVSRP